MRTLLRPSSPRYSLTSFSMESGPSTGEHELVFSASASRATAPRFTPPFLPHDADFVSLSHVQTESRLHKSPGLAYLCCLLKPSGAGVPATHVQPHCDKHFTTVQKCFEHKYDPLSPSLFIQTLT